MTSPYLRRRLRTLDEVIAEVAAEHRGPRHAPEQARRLAERLRRLRALRAAIRFRRPIEEQRQ